MNFKLLLSNIAKHNTIWGGGGGVSRHCSSPLILSLIYFPCKANIISFLHAHLLFFNIYLFFDYFYNKKYVKDLKKNKKFTRFRDITIEYSYSFQLLKYDQLLFVAAQLLREAAKKVPPLMASPSGFF